MGSSGSGQTGSGTLTVNTATVSGTGVVTANSSTFTSVSTLTPGDGTAVTNHGTLTFTPVTGSGTQDLQGSIVLGINTATTTDATYGGNAIGSAGYDAFVDAVTGVGTHDRLVFNNAGNAVGYTVNFLSTTGTLSVQSDSFTPLIGQVFNLLDWGNLVTADFSGFNVGTNYRTGDGVGEGDLDLPDITSSGFFWDVSRFTSSGNIVVIPEPSRMLLLLLGLFGICLRRRRK